MSLESGRRTADQPAAAEVEEVWTDLVSGPADGLWPDAEAELLGRPVSGAADRVEATDRVDPVSDTVDLADVAVGLEVATAAKQAETQAYEDAVKKAFGGKKGLADVGIPAAVFLVIYTATKDLTPALWASVAVAAALTVMRLLRKETLQHALSGLFGVLVCAAFAKFSGRPENYYLPGLLLNVGYGVVCVATAATRWPIVGLMLGPITGEMTAWRQVPGRLRAFTNATWILSAMFVLRVAVQTPLWLTHQTTALGITRLVMGYPLYLAALYFCWQIIKQAPAPVKPAAAGDGESDAEPEAEGGTRSERADA
jgi:hypothetical protein